MISTTNNIETQKSDKEFTKVKLEHTNKFEVANPEKLTIDNTILEFNRTFDRSEPKTPKVHFSDSTEELTRRHYTGPAFFSINPRSDVLGLESAFLKQTPNFFNIRQQDDIFADRIPKITKMNVVSNGLSELSKTVKEYENTFLPKIEFSKYQISGLKNFPLKNWNDIYTVNDLDQNGLLDQSVEPFESGSKPPLTRSQMFAKNYAENLQKIKEQQESQQQQSQQQQQQSKESIYAKLGYEPRDTSVKEVVDDLYKYENMKDRNLTKQEIQDLKERYSFTLRAKTTKDIINYLYEIYQQSDLEEDIPQLERGSSTHTSRTSTPAGSQSGKSIRGTPANQGFNTTLHVASAFQPLPTAQPQSLNTLGRGQERDYDDEIYMQPRPSQGPPPREKSPDIPLLPQQVEINRRIKEIAENWGYDLDKVKEKNKNFAKVLDSAANFVRMNDHDSSELKGFPKIEFEKLAGNETNIKTLKGAVNYLKNQFDLNKKATKLQNLYRGKLAKNKVNARRGVKEIVESLVSEAANISENKKSRRQTTPDPLTLEIEQHIKDLTPVTRKKLAIEEQNKRQLELLERSYREKAAQDRARFMQKLKTAQNNRDIYDFAKRVKGTEQYQMKKEDIRLEAPAQQQEVPVQSEITPDIRDNWLKQMNNPFKLYEHFLFLREQNINKITDNERELFKKYIKAHDNSTKMQGTTLNLRDINKAINLLLNVPDVIAGLKPKATIEDEVLQKKPKQKSSK